jgi:hypothetical protein
MATRRVTVQVRGLREVEKKLDDIFDRLQNPGDGLVRATNKVAEVWGKNFDEEGRAVGGWPELAEMTQSIRESQGFPPEHPILIRYGSLRAVAIEFFEEARREGKTSKGDNYSDETVRGSLDIDRNTATLTVGDSWKVANQWGHPNQRGQRPTPARPFWFVDRHSIAAAKEGVMDWIEDEVLR